MSAFLESPVGPTTCHKASVSSSRSRLSQQAKDCEEYDGNSAGQANKYYQCQPSLNHRSTPRPATRPVCPLQDHACQNQKKIAKETMENRLVKQINITNVSLP